MESQNESKYGSMLDHPSDGRLGINSKQNMKVISIKHEEGKHLNTQFSPAKMDYEYSDSQVKQKMTDFDNVKFIPVVIDTQHYDNSISFFSAIHEKFTLKDIKTTCTGANIKISSMLVWSDRVLLSGIFDQSQKTVCYNWRTKQKTDWLDGVNAVDLKRCGNYILCADLTSGKILLVQGNSKIGQTSYSFSRFMTMSAKGKITDTNTNGLSSNVIATDRNDFVYFSQYFEDTSPGRSQEVKKIVFVRVSARTGEFKEFTTPIAESPYGICLKDGQIFMASLTRPLVKAVFNEHKNKLEIKNAQSLEWDDELSFRTSTTSDNCVFFGGSCTKVIGSFCFGMTDSDLKFLHVKKINDKSLFFWPHKLKLFNSKKGKVLFAYCLRQVIITIKIVGNKFGNHTVHKIDDTLYIYGSYCHKQDNLAEQLIYGFDTLVHVDGNSLLL